MQEYNIIYLNLFSISSIYFAILTIINKNPIVSILFLICLFIFISGYLIFLGMNFIGIAYLLVYIGAVSVLFLFILMLINIRISEIKNDTINSLPLAIVIGIFFLTDLYTIISNNITFFIHFSLFNLFKMAQENLNFVTANTWETNVIEYIHITSLGNLIYTNYFLWLILASIILLLAMIGSIIITVKQNN